MPEEVRRMDKGFLSAAGLTKVGRGGRGDRDRQTEIEIHRERQIQRPREVGKGGNIPRARDLWCSGLYSSLCFLGLHFSRENQFST